MVEEYPKPRKGKLYACVSPDADGEGRFCVSAREATLHAFRNLEEVNRAFYSLPIFFPVADVVISVDTETSGR